MKLSDIPSIDPMQLDMDRVIANSYSNFHAKGLDYICLNRTEDLTLKLYFFSEWNGKYVVPDVVNPHDHRYTFLTKCLSGCVENVWYRDLTLRWGTSGWQAPQNSTTYQKFKYLTPLNGGDGFTWYEEAELQEWASVAYRPGDKYLLQADSVHTIRIREDQTVIAIEQYKDELPIDQPTFTYTQDREPPSLTGLYDKPTADDVVKKLALLKDLMKQ